MDIAHLISNGLKAKGLSQHEAAKMIGVSQQTIHKMATLGLGGIETVRKAGQVLGISASEIDSALTARKAKPKSNVARMADLSPARANQHDKMVPVMGYAAGALPGNGHLIMGEQRALVACPPQLANVEGAFAVYVSGTSMMPRYIPGELLFIHPLKEPAPGDYVVAQIEDETSGEVFGYVKQFLRWDGDELVLWQHNPEGEMRFPAYQVKAINKVVISMV